MIYNFNAGPSHLDESILNGVSESIRNYNKSGLSILEYSHRSSEFEIVLETCKDLIKKFMDLKDDQEIFFMQGGASFQFYALPFNFLRSSDTVCYVDTGRWSSNAIKEAERFANVSIVGTSESSGYDHIPEIEPLDGKYLHITSNNTIYGTQYRSVPVSNIPLVADMSSDILGRKYDYNKFDLIYAGAQKNLGTAGVSVVICKKEFLDIAKDNLPPMLSYKNMVMNNSLFNTPPVLAIYVMLETLKWIDQKGGMDVIDEINSEKATLIYSTIDKSNLFRGIANKNDRSNMNACFTIDNEDLSNKFMKFTKDNGVVGIKGHRTAGGFRASLYNCVPLKYVEVLCDLMKDFENKL